MNILTSNPIVVNNSRVEPTDYYLNISGSNQADAIKAFQYFVNFNDPTARLTLNGLWDKPTEAQAKIYGSRFDKMLSKYPNVIRDINARISGAPTSKGGTSLELMMNPDTASTIQPSAAEIADKKNKGFDWDKATGNWKKISDSGIIDTIAGLFGKNKQPDSYTPQGAGYYPNVSPVGEPKQGMSTGAKVGIAVGVVVAGILIYMAVKNKK